MEISIIVATVTLLLAPLCEGAAYCSGGNFSEEEINQKFLAPINAKRSALANGMERSEVDMSFLPKAKNMNKLTWNCQLEEQAIAAIKNCPKFTTTTGQGYAFFSDNDDNGFDSPTIEQALWAQFSSPSKPLTATAKGVVYVKSNYTTPNKYYGKSYVNLMRAAATEVGCALNWCPTQRQATVYCITNQCTIVQGQIVYKIGEGSCDCLYDCDSNGLCLPYSATTAATTSQDYTADAFEAATTAATAASDFATTAAAAAETFAAATGAPDYTTAAAAETFAAATDAPDYTTAAAAAETFAAATGAPDYTTAAAAETTAAATTAFPDFWSADITTAASSSSDGIAYCNGGSITERKINCQVLSIINHQRFKLANGMQQNGRCYGTCAFLPRAKNMNKLVWSCDLEKKAQAAVKDCVWEPPNTGHGYVFSSFYENRDEITITNLIRQQLSTIDHGLFTSVTSGGVTYSNEDILRGYANLMRSTATKIGCAIKRCHNANHTTTLNLYCITDQPEIRKGDKVYEAGSGSCDCTNFCDPSGLCTATRVSPVCFEAIFPQPTIEDPDTLCGQGDMTDILRILMLDMHNIRRAQLARGQLKYNGKMLPSASNMNRLIWSCALEKDAHDYLSKCPTEGYKKPTCLTPTENFYRSAITSDSTTFKDMTIKTIREWWDVYKSYPNPGASAVFNESLSGTPVESYTRMGWAQSREIGCSIAKCGNDYVVSCRYQPEGNIVNHSMYNVGAVCSECYIFGAGSCGSGGLCG